MIHTFLTLLNALITLWLDMFLLTKTHALKPLEMLVWAQLCTQPNVKTDII